MGIYNKFANKNEHPEGWKHLSPSIFGWMVHLCIPSPDPFHPLGCQAASRSLGLVSEPKTSKNWCSNLAHIETGLNPMILIVKTMVSGEKWPLRDLNWRWKTKILAQFFPKNGGSPSHHGCCKTKSWYLGIFGIQYPHFRTPYAEMIQCWLFHSWWTLCPKNHVGFPSTQRPTFGKIQGPVFNPTRINIHEFNQVRDLTPPRFSTLTHVKTHMSGFTNHFTHFSPPFDSA